MTTAVPSPVFSTNGFVIPSGPAVLTGVQADINAAFGNNLNFNLNTPQGQLASSEAAVISNVYALFQFYTQQMDPAYSSGRMQDGIGRIYFLERNPAEPTTLQIACVGSNVTLPIGATIQDENGNIYAATAAITLPSGGGTITGSFACTVPGPVAVPGASEVSIYQAIPGWDSVSVVSGVEGVNVESRQAYELRRQDSVAGNSFGAIGSIIGAVAKVSGVIDYYGYNNTASTPVTVSGVVIAGNSVYICVSGGAETDVASAILSKLGPGCGMTGNTTVTVYDDNPLYVTPIPYQITYDIPSTLQVLFSVTLVNNPSVPSNAQTLIQNALVAAATQGVVQNNPQVVPGLKARIASTLRALTYVQVINALGPWAQVAAITIGSQNTPASQFTASIAGNIMTVVGVTTGPLAAGQIVSDNLGLMVNSTVIAQQLTGSTGGTGTYLVNNPQTLAGGTFTCTGTGTHLTVSAITGIINVGDVIVGSGIPAGTTILSQSSGSVGGTGVYITSNPTTISGIATIYETVYGYTANQSVVSVQANQEPQILAPNIAVGTT
jgi:hypothetical protein